MRKIPVAFAATILGVLAFTAPAPASHAADYTPCSGNPNGVCFASTIHVPIPYVVSKGDCTTFNWDSWGYQSFTASNILADGTHDPDWTGQKVTANGSQHICFNVVGTDKYTFHFNDALTGSTGGYHSDALTYLVHVS